MTDEDRGDEVQSAVELRASHEDRDRVAEILRVAAGDGRLTPEELDQRVEVSGSVGSGALVARPPRRTFWQWLLRRPLPYALPAR